MHECLSARADTLARRAADAFPAGFRGSRIRPVVVPIRACRETPAPRAGFDNHRFAAWARAAAGASLPNCLSLHFSANPHFFSLPGPARQGGSETESSCAARPRAMRRAARVGGRTGRLRRDHFDSTLTRRLLYSACDPWITVTLPTQCHPSSMRRGSLTKAAPRTVGYLDRSGGRQPGKDCAMNASTALEMNTEATEVMQPCMRAFNGPTAFASAPSRFGKALRNRANAPAATRREPLRSGACGLAPAPSGPDSPLAPDPRGTPRHARATARAPRAPRPG
ncbi:hypothetical protein BGL_2c11980 [Burkholderia plantarii]|uniref:Uncharacterized protein n=1 Tax=Burkholderia plantarii TaxID=41899 RepID=A0A0B6SAJ8_BURPL|nr:hypothetical protein BGL_2c11980 [Burkholderia plantarii]